jgi:hypothetical protein
MFTDVSPEIVNLVGGKHTLPRRHGILSMLNRIDETGMLISRQASQIKSDSRIVLQIVPMAGGTVFCVKSFAFFNCAFLTHSTRDSKSHSQDRR